MYHKAERDTFTGVGRLTHTDAGARVYFFTKKKIINVTSTAIASHQSFATCFEMLNVSKVDREIRTIPPG